MAETSVKKYRIIEIILLIFFFLQLISMGIAPLNEILTEKNVYLILIYAILFILVELQLNQIQTLPKEISKEVSMLSSQKILLPLDKNQLYQYLSIMLDGNKYFRMISIERPIDTDFINKMINDLKLHKNELVIERVNIFHLDYLVWLIELAVLAEGNDNFEFYLTENLPMGIFVGKGGDFERAIIVWGPLKIRGPSSVVYIEGKTLEGKRYIEDLWEYAGIIIKSSVKIKNIDDLNNQILKKFKENKFTIDSININKIENDLEKINDMSAEYQIKIKSRFKKLIEENKFLKDKLSNIKLNS